MSYQQKQLEEERMQRTLNILLTLWYLPHTERDDILFIASELGLTQQFADHFKGKNHAKV